MKSLILLPMPQTVRLLDKTISLAGKKWINVYSERFLLAAKRIQTAFAQQGLVLEIQVTNQAPTEDCAVLLGALTTRNTHYEDGYSLVVDNQMVMIDALLSPVGYWNAACTLTQLIEQYGDELPALHIEDWPDFRRRGVMLDISRDKVPTMETLYALVDQLAGWKINELQLYTEHTFAYSQHRKVWEHASPMTAEHIAALDAYCKDRFVDLVPNQNTFGHMHRWLMHDEYTYLAEVPEGVHWPFMLTLPRPFSISPAVPESLPFVQGLLDELLPNFSSPYVNIGCDETLDLGRGRSKALVEAQGKGRVYLEFLKQIAAHAQAKGRIVQFWGDIIVQHPELVPELPKNLIALEWGYEADHPFATNGAIFAQSGIPFYVCPGTSTWLSLVGRTDNALGNLRNAAENGKQHGAMGYLITDWGDYGHLQPLPASYLGFAYGAALSWAVKANTDLDLTAVLNQLVFRDTAGIMGKFAQEVGEVYELYDDMPNPNGSTVVRALFNTIDFMKTEKIPGQKEVLRVTPSKIQAMLAEFDRLSAMLNAAQPADPLIVPEFQLTIALFRHACKRMLMLAGDESIPKRALASEIRALIGTYCEQWLKRNRVGGLGDSLTRLTRLLAEYEA